MPFALFDVVTPTGAAVVVFATIISHFVRQANKSHAAKNNQFFMQTRVYFQFGLSNWNTHRKLIIQQQQQQQCNAIQRAQQRHTKRERERSVLAWQAQLISYCNCITTETRCYGKFPLAVVVGAVLLLQLLLLLLCCSYCCVRITADLQHAATAADSVRRCSTLRFLFINIFINFIDFLL